MTLRRLLEQVGGIPLDAEIKVNVGYGDYEGEVRPVSDAIVFNPQNQTITLEV